MGQFLKLLEREAREKYGDRLTIASLSSVDKGLDSEDEMEV